MHARRLTGALISLPVDDDQMCSPTPDCAQKHRTHRAGNHILNGSADKRDEHMALQVIPNFTPRHIFPVCGKGGGAVLENWDKCTCKRNKSYLVLKTNCAETEKNYIK